MDRIENEADYEKALYSMYGLMQEGEAGNLETAAELIRLLSKIKEYEISY